MNIRVHLMTLALMAISAAGITSCEQVAITTIARSVEDGDRIDKSWVRIWKDRARFECVASTSGLCQVVVFVAECPSAACKTRIIREFKLLVGKSADLVGLPPGFRFCLSHAGKPVAPVCTNV